MRLKVLGSSSSGNCYILQGESESLILECGIKFKEVEKALDYNLKNVVGALISHEHGDHSKYVSDFLNRFIPVYTSKGTAEALDKRVKIIDKMKPFQIGGFKIIAFEVFHDAVDPIGFFVNHKECGNVLFATDTYYLKPRFKGLNNILIECNYREDILLDNVHNGRLSSFLMNRITESHLEYNTCKEALLANDLTDVNNIVLIHLSDGNSNAKEFKQGIERATAKTVYVAEKGMDINFNKTPF